jgi:hypothetical protein
MYKAAIAFFKFGMLLGWVLMLPITIPMNIIRRITRKG